MKFPKYQQGVRRFWIAVTYADGSMSFNGVHVHAGQLTADRIWYEFCVQDRRNNNQLSQLVGV